jgi:hypothetical protein
VGHFVFSKSINSILCADPNVAFAILKKGADSVARKPISASHSLDSPLTEMKQALAKSSDPNASVVIDKNTPCYNVSASWQERLGFFMLLRISQQPSGAR